MFALLFLSAVLLQAGCENSGKGNHNIRPDSSSVLSRYIIVGDGCDGCDLMYEGMPPVSRLTWYTKIAGNNEPGEPMEITGTIYTPGGKKPAAGIILYVYHTDAEGHYSPSPGQAAGKRHGHLRGWMKTNEKGQYRFLSIRPAQYPGRKFAAHIHPTIKEPYKLEYYIDDYFFDDDALTTEEKNRTGKRGGSGIIHLTKTGGVWKGHRDIILGLNIPNYK